MPKRVREEKKRTPRRYGGGGEPEPLPARVPDSARRTITNTERVLREIDNALRRD